MFFEIKIEVWCVVHAETGRIESVYSNQSLAETRRQTMQAAMEEPFGVVGPYVVKS